VKRKRLVTGDVVRAISQRSFFWLKLLAEMGGLRYLRRLGLPALGVAVIRSRGMATTRHHLVFA
jgi:hypothetical protein